MRKMSAGLLLLLACCCALGAAGCGGRGEPKGASSRGADVDALVAEINAFTDELISKIGSAADPAAGVGQAQELLDGRGHALKGRVAEVRAGAQFRESEEARGRLLECEINNTDRVSKLRTQHLDLWMRDAAFKAKLDKLVSDYQDLFK